MLPKRDAAQHPDAALTALWDAYTATMTAYNATPEPADAPFEKIADQLAEQIERATPCTADGLRVQARYLFVTHSGSKDAWRSAVHGDAPSERLTTEMKGDFITRTLWNMVQAAQKIGGAQ